MRMNPTREKVSGDRRGERGAALVTTLMLSTLLLLAGGALIVKTSGAVGVAFDATSEMQAYYAAEGGLQAALNVLRGNHQNGAADKATFAKAVADGGTLAAWLNYGANNRVLIGDAHSYSVVVTDATVPPVGAGESPQRLLITSTGYGPRGARKELAMLIRNSAEIEIPGGVTLRGIDGGSGSLEFILGTSAKRKFTSDDPTKPVFVTTTPGDTDTVTTTTDEDKKHVVYSDPTVEEAPEGSANFPDFLTSPETCEGLIEDLEAAATPDNGIKIINGDYSAPKDGEGIWVVRGKLTFGGSTTFRGIILVLGQGEIEWSGDGDITGAIFVANYSADMKGFDAPILNIKGAGTSYINYSPDAVNEALAKLSFRIVGVQEQ